MHPPSHKYPISARQYLRRAPRGRDQRRWDNDAAACFLASLLASLEKLLQHFLPPTMGIISIEKNKLFHVGLVFPLSRTTGAGGVIGPERLAGSTILSSAKRDDVGGSSRSRSRRQLFVANITECPNNRGIEKM